MRGRNRLSEEVGADGSAISVANQSTKWMDGASFQLAGVTPCLWLGVVGFASVAFANLKGWRYCRKPGRLAPPPHGHRGIFRPSFELNAVRPAPIVGA